MLSREEDQAVFTSTNTSSESDSAPSSTCSSPARSIKPRFGRQYKSKRSQIDDHKQNINNSIISTSTSTSTNKKNKVHKAVVLYLILQKKEEEIIIN